MKSNMIYCGGGGCIKFKICEFALTEQVYLKEARDQRLAFGQRPNISMVDDPLKMPCYQKDGRTYLTE